MFNIGLDLGYGFVKGVNEAGKGVVFPAIVGNAYDRPLAKLFGSDEESIINNMHLVMTHEKREEYFIGELARRESRNASYAFDDDKINHPNTKALLAASVLLLFPKEDMPIHLVTGLPLEQYIHKKDDFKKMLKEHRIIASFNGNGKTKTVKFDKITIFPQAAGAVYSIIIDDLQKYLIRGSYIGLIDIGFKTTDYIVFMVDEKLVLREDMSGTINIGMSRLNNAADKIFTKKTGSKLEVAELMNLVKDEQIFFRGSKLNFSNEIALIKSEISRVIKDRIKALWGDKLDFFNTVFLAGGGAKELEPFISNIHPNTVLTKNPQFANAEGFLKVAQLGEKKEKRVG